MNKTKVFLSSTSKDLDHFRLAIIKALTSSDAFEWEGMERFSSALFPPLETCLSRLDSCDFYVGIIGHYRGSCPPQDKISFTEHEYNHAKRVSKHMLMFVAKDDMPVPANLRMGDTDHSMHENFKGKVLVDHKVNFFNNPDQLAIDVLNALNNALLEINASSKSTNSYAAYITPSIYHHILIKYRNSISLNEVDFKPGSSWQLHPKIGDKYIQGLMFIGEDFQNTVIYDFTKGKLPRGMECQRTSTAFYRPKLLGEEILAAPGMPRFEEIKPGVSALLLEPSKINYLRNSSKPQSQRPFLNRGIYTLWCEGYGHVTIDKPKQSKVEPGKPYSFVIREDSYVHLIVFGQLSKIQLENGKGNTSFILTGDFITTRAKDAISFVNPAIRQ